MDDGGMNKRKWDDGAGTSGAMKKMARTPKDDDVSSAEADVPISSTEATVIGEGSALQPLAEEDDKNPTADSALSNETAAAAPSHGNNKLATPDLISTIRAGPALQPLSAYGNEMNPAPDSALSSEAAAAAPSHGNKLETLDLISKVGAEGGSSSGGAGHAFAGGDVLSLGMIVQSSTRSAPNAPLTSWGIRCRHCGVPTPNVGVYPAQHVCLCHACRINVDAVCPVCGLRGFFPCPGCGVVAAARGHYPVLHHCLCQACLNDHHSVCLVCGAGALGGTRFAPDSSI